MISTYFILFVFVPNVNFISKAIFIKLKKKDKTVKEIKIIRNFFKNC